VNPYLQEQVAAARAAAEIVRREQAARSARDVLQSIGHSPREAAQDILRALTGPRAAALRAAVAQAAPSMRPLLSNDRKALISEAMGHWAKGHAVYERLDPGLKARVRAIAERLAPK